MQKRLETAIQAACGDQRVRAEYQVTDTSVKAELRLTVVWRVRHRVDRLNAPKSLSGIRAEPWERWEATETRITKAVREGSDKKALTFPTRKVADREAAKVAREEIEEAMAREFLACYRKAVRRVDVARREVVAIQAEQKTILKAMRTENGAFLADRKTQKAARAAEDQAALETGEFWKVHDERLLKDFFNTPFEKNHLADISERWRAVLFTECESTAWKDWNKNWRHKLVGTGRGYLAGVDDNGDQWGLRVDLSPSYDRHGNIEVGGTVEEAMSVVFQVPISALASCERQGDLLFRKAEPSEEVAFHPQPEPWEVRESHQIAAEELERNGRWFRAPAEITVSHTSHAAVVLPAGTYRLYMSAQADAD